MGRKQQPLYENVLQQKVEELFEESREKLRTVNDLKVCFMHSPTIPVNYYC